MPFVPEVYVPRREMAVYDGTNSADIMAHPWSPPITLVSEVDGVLTLGVGDGEHYEEFAVPTGDYIVVGNGTIFGGYMPPGEVASNWVKVTP